VLGPGSIVPTAVQSGQWIVSHPATATLECHVQYVPAQADPDGYGTRVEREIEAAVLAASKADSWLARHPPRFAWPGDVPAGWVGPEAPISVTTLDAMAALGLPRRVASRTTFFDGPTFTRAGIPTIACGPGDIGLAHAVDESVGVDELVRGAQLLALAAMRFCGVAT
jgi:acetylornithine deacetylase